jgi:thiol-disulfide isomerase/thioredoxin
MSWCCPKLLDKEPVMTPATRLLAILAALLSSLTVSATGPEAIARYRFQPGQEITYRCSSVFKYGEGKTAGEHGSQSDWTIWVVRVNKGDSFHLVLREKNTFSQTFQGKKFDQPPHARIVYADVFTDGRVRMNKTIQYQGHPGTLFPRLPRDAAQIKSGWQSAQCGDRTSFKFVQSKGGFVFEAIRHSPMDKIYLSSNKSKYTYDSARGFVTRAESENTQGYGFNGKGSGTTELVSVKMMEPASVQAFADAADKYFAALAAYEDKTEAADKAEPKQAKDLLDKAVYGLKTAAAGIDNKDFKSNLTEKITQHERMAKYHLDSAERRAKVLGKPAAEFETTDIDGKKVKLADLRGKVVVLDFWYRGCGWCVKAMPQMNQLAEDFAGKPVAIFGMNTDRKEEDARFVIEKMALKYPSLKAQGLPQKFGVQAFPSLIIIDQEGKVHDIHVGYSPTLREDVGKEIRNLLASK